MARQTKNLAVLFADITESTKLYSTLGDNAARVVVNACLSLLADVVARNKGSVVKTIGDEAMCVFQRADDAVLAASEMQSQVDAKRPGKAQVQIHVGLHYGPALIEDDDIFGDTVNAAAYLTAVATSGQILTTEATERNLSPELKSSVRPVFKAVLKGSTDETTVYQVVWHKDVDDLTDVNVRSHKIIPSDQGSLIVAYGDLSLRLTASLAYYTVDADLAAQGGTGAPGQFAANHYNYLVADGRVLAPPINDNPLSGFSPGTSAAFQLSDFKMDLLVFDLGLRAQYDIKRFYVAAGVGPAFYWAETDSETVESGSWNAIPGTGDPGFYRLERSDSGSDLDIGLFASLSAGVHVTQHVSVELEYRFDEVSGKAGTSQAELDLSGQSGLLKVVFDF